MFKDQTSLIVFIVAVLLGAIGVGTVYFTKPEVQPVAPIETVPLAAAKLPAAGVTYANALPGAGAGGNTGAPSGLGGGSRGMGMGGPMGGMSGAGIPGSGGRGGAGGASGKPSFSRGG